MSQVNTQTFYNVNGTLAEVLSAFNRMDETQQALVIDALGYQNDERLEVNFGLNGEDAAEFNAIVSGPGGASIGEGCWSVEVESTNDLRRMQGVTYTVSGRHNTATHCTCPSHDPAKGGRLECKHMETETFGRQEHERLRIARSTLEEGSGTLYGMPVPSLEGFLIVGRNR